MELIVAGIVAVIVVGLEYYNQYDQTAKRNKTLADLEELKGVPIEIMEIKKWTSQARYLWVKVRDMRPFNPGSVVTIIDKPGSPGTDFKGTYVVKDMWRDFPNFDPGQKERNMYYYMAIIGIYDLWNVEQLPFAHDEGSAVLKLKANHDLPNHDEPGGLAQIYHGGPGELKSVEIRNLKIAQIKYGLQNIKEQIKPWHYIVSVLSLILIIYLLSNDNE